MLLAPHPANREMKQSTLCDRTWGAQSALESWLLIPEPSGEGGWLSLAAPRAHSLGWAGTATDLLWAGPLLNLVTPPVPERAEPCFLNYPEGPFFCPLPDPQAHMPSLVGDAQALSFSRPRPCQNPPHWLHVNLNPGEKPTHMSRSC